MYSYIKGEIKEIGISNVTIENNAIGYLVNVANPHSFKIDENIKLYLYQYVREDELTLYGFRNHEEKEMFLKLISVNGVGCKMALPFLATNTPSEIISAIEREDITYLKKFPKIGDKVARQIILDLKGKLVATEESKVNIELVETLKALGYKTANIDKVVSQVNSSLSLEEQIKESLKLLLK